MADFKYTGPTEEDLRIVKKLLKLQRDGTSLVGDNLTAANALKATRAHKEPRGS